MPQHRIYGSNPACEVCGGVDDSLTRECCGLKLAPAMLDAIIAGLDFHGDVVGWVLRKHEADHVDVERIREFASALSKLAYATTALCAAEVELARADAVFNQCNTERHEALAAVRAVFASVAERVLLVPTKMPDGQR